MKTPEESAQTTPETTGADLLVKALIDEDVEVVFGYPGGAEHKSGVVGRSTQIRTKRKVSDPDFVQ